MVIAVTFWSAKDFSDEAEALETFGRFFVGDTFARGGEVGSGLVFIGVESAGGFAVGFGDVVGGGVGSAAFQADKILRMLGDWDGKEEIEERVEGGGGLP